MNVLVLLLLILGFVLLLLGSFRVAHPKVDLIGLGLACWILTAILTNSIVAGA